jgi:DNA mismatch repair protein MutS2
VPGASHALSVAERLGLPADVLARARELAPAETQALEKLLAELQQTRREWDAERQRLAEARAAAEAAGAQHREATQDTRRSLEDLRRRLTKESEAILSQARDLWQTVQREAKRAEKSRAGAEELKSRLGAVERSVDELQQSARGAAAEAGGGEVEPATFTAQELVPGRRVRVVDLGIEAEVASPPDAEGRVHLRRGTWSIQSHISKLARPEGEAPHDADVRPRASWEAPDDAAGLEVHLLGLDADEALRALDIGLDRAVLSGIGEIRIVHGVGRGVLRSVVERHLRDHPQVVSQRLGVVGEGGRGVTIARLR